MTNYKNLIYQFKITLLQFKPAIWRTIQVPASYNFWDLHVAIQDSMGWLDYHLHAFRFGEPFAENTIEIGIPVDDFGECEPLPGWEIKISDHFTHVGTTAQYKYDFGDGWEHEILLDGILAKENRGKYPRCIAGKRACPPEDCGGIGGYEQTLTILADPKHSEFEETVHWLKNHAKNYYPYRPNEFNPASVRFDDPQERWETAFADQDVDELGS